MSNEQPAEFYDRKAVTVPHRAAHYTASPYFALWSVVADRVRRLDPQSVLDIGCGSGQFAALLADMAPRPYLGIDFSRSMIAIARSQCPAAQFRHADIREDDALENHPYDCVVTTEFLEHIEGDLAVIERIRPGTAVIASVPDYPARSHVRHFRNPEAVRERFGSLIRDLDICPLRVGDQGNTIFIMQGVR